VHIPPGGLYEDVVISIIENMSVSRDSENYEIPGKVFQVEGPKDEVFKQPIEIGIPYDPSSLPSNRSEDDIFPVMMIEGVWYRAEGYVDKDNNVVHAITLHNGDWSWAYDKAAEWIGEIVSFFREESETPENLSDALALLEQREIELQRVWEESSMRIDSTVSSEEILFFIEDTLKGEVAKIIIHASTAPAIGLAGKAGVLYVGNVPVGVIMTTGAAAGMALIKAVGIAGGLVLVVKLARDNVVALDATLKLELAIQRLIEAKAIIWVLQNPEAVTISPEYQIALNDYYAALQISQTTSMPLELDLAISAYDDPVDTAAKVGWTIFEAFQFRHPLESTVTFLDETRARIDFSKEGEANLTGEYFTVEIVDIRSNEYALQECLRDSVRTDIRMVDGVEFYVRDGYFGPANDLDAVQEDWKMRYGTTKGVSCVSFSYYYDQASNYYEEFENSVYTFEWTIGEPEWPDPVIATEELLTGTIIGMTRNPAGPYFSGRVEAVNVNTGEIYWTDVNKPAWKSHRFEITGVTPGIYTLIAFDHTGWPFGYTEWSICEWDRDPSNPDECNWASHDLLEVHVFAEQVTFDILTYDFNAPALIEKYTEYYD